MGYEFFGEKIIFPSAPVPGINNDQSLNRHVGLTSILHLLNMIEIDVKDQTLMTLDQHAVISTLKETLESRFVNDFFTVIKDINKLQLYSNLKQSFEESSKLCLRLEEDYLSEVKLYKYRTNTGTFAKKSIEKDKRACTLCIGNKLVTKSTTYLIAHILNL